MATPMEVAGAGPETQILPVVRVKFEHTYLNERRTVLIKRPIFLEGLRQTMLVTFGQDMTMYYQSPARGMMLIRSQADLDAALHDIDPAAPLPCLRLTVSHEPSPGAIEVRHDLPTSGGGPGARRNTGMADDPLARIDTGLPHPAHGRPNPFPASSRGFGQATGTVEVIQGPEFLPHMMSPNPTKQHAPQRPEYMYAGSDFAPQAGPMEQPRSAQALPSAGPPAAESFTDTRSDGPTGHILAGTPSSWTLGRKLGVGGFGHVYLCHDVDTGQQFALKQVHFEESGSAMQKEVRALEDEIEMLKSIKHERIVAYIGVHRTDSALSILMEYMPGGSIHSYVKENGPLTETLTRKYTQQILEGLVYLHSRRIIHRDVKGANILRDSNGNVKLADFGASRQLRTIRSLMTNKSIQGTPYWMSPEVINGAGYDEKADVWSLGCTMVEMLTTKPPWFEYEPMQALFKIGRGDNGGPTIPSSISLLCRHFLQHLFTFDYRLRPSAADMMKHDFLHSKADNAFA